MRLVMLWIDGERPPVYILHRRFAVLLAREPVRARLSAGLDDLFSGRPSAVVATAEHQGVIVDPRSLAQELIGSCRPAGVVLTREAVMGARRGSDVGLVPEVPDHDASVGSVVPGHPGAGTPGERGQALRLAARAREAAIVANDELKRRREVVERATATVRRLEAEVRRLSAEVNAPGSNGSGGSEGGGRSEPNGTTAQEPLTPERRTDIEQAHNDAVKAAEQADHRAFPRVTRRRLERAREAESRLLASHGFVSFADYVIGAAEGAGRLAKAESQLRGARAAALAGIADLRTGENMAKRAAAASAAADGRRTHDEAETTSAPEELAVAENQMPDADGKNADGKNGNELEPTGGLGSAIRSLLSLGSSVPGVPRAPVVVDDAFASLPDDTVRDLLDLLEREAGDVQILYLTDDRRVLRWADDAGPERAAVCLPLQRRGTGMPDQSVADQPPLPDQPSLSDHLLRFGSRWPTGEVVRTNTLER